MKSVPLQHLHSFTIKNINLKLIYAKVTDQFSGELDSYILLLILRLLWHI